MRLFCQVHRRPGRSSGSETSRTSDGALPAPGYILLGLSNRETEQEDRPYKEMGVEEKDTNGGTLVTLAGGMADAVERARRAVVKARTPAGAGRPAVWSLQRAWYSRRTIPSNATKISPSRSTRAARSEGSSLVGTPASDLALLRVEGLGLSDLAERTGGYRRCAHR
jgi:hypothetical protein